MWENDKENVSFGTEKKSQQKQQNTQWPLHKKYSLEDFLFVMLWVCSMWENDKRELFLYNRKNPPQNTQWPPQRKHTVEDVLFVILRVCSMWKNDKKNYSFYGPFPLQGFYMSSRPFFYWVGSSDGEAWRRLGPRSSQMCSDTLCDTMLLCNVHRSALHMRTATTHPW